MMASGAHATRRSLSRWPSARSLASALAALSLSAAGREAAAQAPPLPESVTIGAFTFRPSIEVRVRGEARVHAAESGGDVYESSAILAQTGSQRLPPLLGTGPAVDTQFAVAERSRIGLTVEGGPVTGVFVLQDARAIRSFQPVFTPPGEPALPSLAPLEAYVDLHTRSGRRMSLRVGRQRVTWGDGRLISEDDWSPTARSLDAVRASIAVGDVDIEAMGALLSAPRTLVRSTDFDPNAQVINTYAQLYGLDITWRFLPLLNIELTGLARFARAPTPTWLAPSDTYVADARFFGEYRGFRYAVEGAYELGHINENNVSLNGLALAARAGLETSLPLHLTFEAEGAFASGGQGAPVGSPAVATRFDPIFPDTHTSLSPMNMFAWSNIATVGGDVRMKLVDELGLMVGYRFAMLADPQDRWSTADLVPVGVANYTRSTVWPTLGHEIDVALKLSPYRGLDFAGGYGLFVFGEEARATLESAGRLAGLGHWAYLQTTFHAP